MKLTLNLTTEPTVGLQVYSDKMSSMVLTKLFLAIMSLGLDFISLDLEDVSV